MDREDRETVFKSVMTEIFDQMSDALRNTGSMMKTYEDVLGTFPVGVAVSMSVGDKIVCKGLLGNMRGISKCLSALVTDFAVMAEDAKKED